MQKFGKFFSGHPVLRFYHYTILWNIIVRKQSQSIVVISDKSQGSVARDKLDAMPGGVFNYLITTNLLLSLTVKTIIFKIGEHFGKVMGKK